MGHDLGLCQGFYAAGRVDNGLYGGVSSKQDSSGAFSSSWGPRFRFKVDLGNHLLLRSAPPPAVYQRMDVRPTERHGQTLVYPMGFECHVGIWYLSNLYPEREHAHLTCHHNSGRNTGHKSFDPSHPCFCSLQSYPPARITFCPGCLTGFDGLINVSAPAAHFHGATSCTTPTMYIRPCLGTLARSDDSRASQSYGSGCPGASPGVSPFSAQGISNGHVPGHIGH